jgi:hypothetical protein
MTISSGRLTQHTDPKYNDTKHYIHLKKACMVSSRPPTTGSSISVMVSYD